MRRGTRERQPLLPPARERPRELLRPLGESKLLHELRHASFTLSADQPVHTGVKANVLGDGEIVVEPESL